MIGIIDYGLGNIKAISNIYDKLKIKNSLVQSISDFEKVEKSLKLPFGPIISPKPGPTFEIAVAEPDIAETKSRPSKDRSEAKMKKIKK